MFLCLLAALVNLFFLPHTRTCRNQTHDIQSHFYMLVGVKQKKGLSSLFCSLLAMSVKMEAKIDLQNCLKVSLTMVRQQGKFY